MKKCRVILNRGYLTPPIILDIACHPFKSWTLRKNFESIMSFVNVDIKRGQPSFVKRNMPKMARWHTSERLLYANRRSQGFSFCFSFDSPRFLATKRFNFCSICNSYVCSLIGGGSLNSLKTSEGGTIRCSPVFTRIRF